MLKPYLSCLIAMLLLLGVATQSALAAPQSDKQKATPETIETIKSQIAKLGLGEKAKATIRLKDGTKVKGYVARAGDDDLVLRDRKTDTPTIVHYSDVIKVEPNGGHSTARNVTLGATIGVAAGITTLLIILIHG